MATTASPKRRWRIARKRATSSESGADDELLRIATAGSVDDGKSTLIGRLLHDTKSIFEDQLASIERTSVKRGDEHTDLALLTDGLRAEREQGITIDVAHRYFATPKRKFVIADTPGHIQYTRNMVTGASNANLALLLVDARKGVLEQTRRHALLSSLLRVPHLVLCVNKMDLVDYDEKIYDEIREDFTTFAAKLEITDLDFVPISALEGDNVVERSTNMPWFDGQPLLGQLEDVHIASDRNLVDNRFPVQYVIRPQSAEHRDYRGFAGSVVGGIFKQGDEVMVLPSRKTSTISEIDTPNGVVAQSFPPMAVTLLLEDELDISRGDMICRPSNQPTASNRFEAMVCWFDETSSLRTGRPVPAQAHDPLGQPPRSRTLRYHLNVDTLHRDLEAEHARGQRHRPGLDPHHLAALLRRVPAEPHHRQLHPRRPRHRPHRRRRDDHRRRQRADRGREPSRSSPRTSPSTRASSPARSAGGRWARAGRRSG